MSFWEGWQPSEIARMLNTENVSGVHGESRWAAVSVVRILQNEKYKGDLLMQKYYIRDFLTKELEKNDGKLTQYYVENDHEAIIEREIWDAAQLEINRIKEFKRNHQIRELGSSSLEPFYGKNFCGCCGGRMVKKSRKSVWRCINSGKEKGGFCKAKPVEGHKMEEYVSAAWAQLVSQRENLLPGWEKDIAQGNALERLRAAQMKELTEKYPAWFQAAKKTRMVIGEIIIGGDKGCEILFMDGVRLVTD